MKNLYTLLIALFLAVGVFGQNDYWFQKGVKVKKPVKKIEYFTKSIEMEGAAAETYLNRGDVYHSLAIDALSKHRKFVIIWDKDKADFHKPKVMFEKARMDFTKAMEVDSNCTQAYINRSKVYWQLGDNDKALADASLLIKIKPEDPAGYLRRGFLYRNNFGDSEKALVDFSKAIEIEPNNTDAYRSRAFTYYHLEEYENALADFNKVIEIDPEDAISYWRRGDIYRCTGEYDKALTEYNRVIKMDVPYYYLVYNSRGLIYFIQGQYEKALKDFKKAISKQPSYYLIAYNNAAYVYLQQGKTDLAIKYFNKSISERDKRDYFFAPNLNLALLYYENGDQEKAKLYLEQARELDPSLQDSTDSVFKSIQKFGVYWTEKDKDTMAKMFEEIK
jgi:tetratricopeptide (TPR) repeat protein